MACCFVLTSAAQKTIDTIATKVDGYDIPIRIKLPKNTTGKNPVYFFVHGGGWNGGTATTVPPARLSTDANYLADQLGVIYVGLAYRCKGNNATFADAIQDLEASVQWFFDNADTYNADLIELVLEDHQQAPHWQLLWLKNIKTVNYLWVQKACII